MEPSHSVQVAAGGCGRDCGVRHDPHCQRLFTTMFESNPAAIMITDQDNRIIAVNPGFSQLTGYSVEEALGRTPSMLKSGRHDGAFYQAMWRDLSEYGSWTGEIWDRRKDGSLYPKWLHIKVVPGAAADGSGTVDYYVASFMDVSARKEAEEQIRKLAYHDVLTGLPNRLLLRDRLQHAMANAERRSQHLAVLFIDLDSFKNVNDSLGHAAGDMLLMGVASRLRDCVRNVDTVARLGGDEFVVVLEGLESEANAVAIATKIHATLSRPMAVGAQSLHASASIGIAIYPEDGASAETLMQNADTAMYQAKAQGRGNSRFFAPIMNELAREKLALENTLLGCLERDEFHLYYQPILDLASGNLASVEALIRWHSPERGLVPPDKFIPIAEETGAIVQIGDWVLRQACRDLVAWRTQGLTPPRVSINISPRQFRQPGLTTRIRAILQEYDVAASQLELEVTESALMERPDQAASLLHDLKAQGWASSSTISAPAILRWPT